LLVTHDPEEAMFMADRIALMRGGRIEQIGRPVELYFHPVSAFAASFFSDVNRLTGTVANGRVATPFGALDAGQLPNGAAVEILIRPEALHLAWAPDTRPNQPNARVTAARLLGRSTLLHLNMDGGQGRALHLHSRVPKHVAFAEGDTVEVSLDVSQAFVFPALAP
jgi:iron(III) transport system ATP-binding protein